MWNICIGFPLKHVIKFIKHVLYFKTDVGLRTPVNTLNEHRSTTTSLKVSNLLKSTV